MSRTPNCSILLALLRHCSQPSCTLDSYLTRNFTSITSLHGPVWQAVDPGTDANGNAGNTCYQALQRNHNKRQPEWAWHGQLSQPRRQLSSNTDKAAASPAASITAPAPASWLDRNCPPQLLPYAQLTRLDRPIGTWLLAWPCMWSIAQAAPAGSLPDLQLLALFGTGAFLLRSAGCIVNDLWDRKLDAKVERTRHRPLASGALTPAAAVGLLGGHLVAGLAVLLQLNEYSVLLGASSLGLVFTYPLMKRFTHWPQAYLGLTFNWGALLGWAAVRGSCEWPVVLPMYAAGVCWTLVYDTIYAHQDKTDDVHAGVKSTALLFGSATQPILAGFAAANIGLLALSGWAAGCGVPYTLGLTAGACQLAWQISTVNLDSRTDCMAKFVSNKWFGALIFTGTVADKLMQ